MVKHDAIDASFYEKISTAFKKILMDDVELMLNVELKVLRLYLPPFFNYRENLGARPKLPPQSGAC